MSHGGLPVVMLLSFGTCLAASKRVGAKGAWKPQQQVEIQFKALLGIEEGGDETGEAVRSQCSGGRDKLSGKNAAIYLWARACPSPCVFFLF